MGLDHAIAVLILIGLPLWGYRKEKRLSESKDSAEKIKIYSQLAAILGITSLIITLAHGVHQTFRFDMIGRADTSWGWYGMLIVLGLFILVNLLPFLLLRSAAFRASVKDAFDRRSHVYPKTAKERSAYIAATIFVGIGEEVMYRSFLTAYINQYWFPQSLIYCIIIANFLFAATHYHQGITGIVNAFAAGISFSALFMLTGTLIVPIIIHIIYDLKLLWISKAYESVTQKART